MPKQEKILLFAYGTNIAQSQMLSHCDNSVLLGYGTLLDYELKFEGFKRHAIANLVKKRNSELPVAIYEVQPEARFTIDNFEKFPYKYKKLKAHAIFNGQKVKGWIYILKQKLPPNVPGEAYLKALHNAYWEADFDQDIIDNAYNQVKDIK